MLALCTFALNVCDTEAPSMQTTLPVKARTGFMSDGISVGPRESKLEGPTLSGLVRGALRTPVKLPTIPLARGRSGGRALPVHPLTPPLPAGGQARAVRMPSGWQTQLSLYRSQRQKGILTKVK